MFRSISIKILKQNGSSDSGLISTAFKLPVKSWTSPGVPKCNLKYAKVHKIWGSQYNFIWNYLVE